MTFAMVSCPASPHDAVAGTYQEACQGFSETRENFDPSEYALITIDHLARERRCIMQL